MASMWHLFHSSCVCGECVAPVLCELCLWRVCGTCSVRAVFVASMWHLFCTSCVCGEYVAPVLYELCLWRVCGTCSVRVVFMATVALLCQNCVCCDLLVSLLCLW